MILDIVKYGHPALREKGKRIDPDALHGREIRQLAADMIETMYAANGVGLAAHQVGRPLMLTVIDVSDADPDRPSQMFVAGRQADIPSLMPLVLANPVLSNARDEEIGSEGCLSVPEITAEIRRATRVTVHALNLEAKEIEFEVTGLLARAAQHELDHLNGILFIDRLDAATRVSLSGKLKKIQKETLAGLEKSAKPRRRALVKL